MSAWPEKAERPRGGAASERETCNARGFATAAAPPTSRPGPGLECTAWKPLRPRRATLIGFADVRLPRAGFTLSGCLVHERDGNWWVYPPASELRNGDGERAGWKELIAFDGPAAKRAWSAAAAEAVAAYRAAHPEAEARPETGWEW